MQSIICYDFKINKQDRNIVLTSLTHKNTINYTQLKVKGLLLLCFKYIYSPTAIFYYIRLVIASYSFTFNNFYSKYVMQILRYSTADGDKLHLNQNLELTILYNKVIPLNVEHVKLKLFTNPEQRFLFRSNTVFPIFSVLNMLFQC